MVQTAQVFFIPRLLSFVMNALGFQKQSSLTTSRTKGEVLKQHCQYKTSNKLLRQPLATCLFLPNSPSLACMEASGTTKAFCTFSTCSGVDCCSGLTLYLRMPGKLLQYCSQFFLFASTIQKLY